MSWIGWIAKAIIAGFFYLYAANTAAGWADIHIAINPFTAFIAGGLKIPGMLSLVAVQFIT